MEHGAPSCCQRALHDRLIEAAGLPGRTQIWADALHDGPVPDVPDDELVRVRARFIASGLDVTPEAVEADLRHWRAVVDDHAGYDELVLWFEHDLFDQLNLIQLLSRIGRDRIVPKPVSLISIDSYPGHPQFKGLGELTPADIASLFTARAASRQNNSRWPLRRGTRSDRRTARNSRRSCGKTPPRCRSWPRRCSAISTKRRAATG